MSAGLFQSAVRATVSLLSKAKITGWRAQSYSDLKCLNVPYCHHQSCFDTAYDVLAFWIGEQSSDLAKVVILKRTKTTPKTVHAEILRWTRMGPVILRAVQSSFDALDGKIHARLLDNEE